MKIYIFIGICAIIGGVGVLISGNAAWGLIQVEGLTGLQLYLSSIPMILLGIYILYYNFNRDKLRGDKRLK